MTQPNTIRTLSDSALLKRLNTLAEKERATTLEILLHLNEIDRRRLFLGQGYPSLFAYCTGHLKYSESAAGRRIRAARCAGAFPEVRQLLAKNEVNVTTISSVAGVLTKKNKKAVLRAIRGKSQRQVNVVVSRCRPQRAVYDRVRPVAVLRLKSERRNLESVGARSTVNPAVSSSADGLQVDSRELASQELMRSRALGKWQEVYRRSGGKKLTTAAGFISGDSHTAGLPPGNSDANSTTDDGEFIIEDKFELKFAVSPDFMRKLDEVKALLSNRFPTGVEFEQLFEALVDEFIDRHSPTKKTERREQRRQQKVLKKGQKESPKQPPVVKYGIKADPKKRSRHISAATKDKVFTRDRGKCTYVSANGKRCNSTWGLQIDHIEPYAWGGTNGANNLRLLCGKHNRLEAKRIMGAGVSSSRNRRE